MSCVSSPAAPEAGDTEVPAVVYVRLRPLNVGLIEKLAHPAYSVAPDGALLLSLPNKGEDVSPAPALFRVNGRYVVEASLPLLDGLWMAKRSLLFQIHPL